MNYFIFAILLYVIIVLAYRAVRRPGRHRLENFGMTMSAIVLSLLMQSVTPTLFYVRIIANILLVVLMLFSIRSAGNKVA